MITYNKIQLLLYGGTLKEFKNKFGGLKNGCIFVVSNPLMYVQRTITGLYKVRNFLQIHISPRIAALSGAFSF